jgi:SAM-dependent methyltransferase
MTFDVSADSYASFMGRYAEPLAVRFADWTAVRVGRALDVGCGSGALAAELARRLGPGAVCAVEPSASLARAAAERLPAVAVSRAAAENLPFADGALDAALAQLVVHFMADAVTGLREMGRVTRPGGTVAACVWDFGGGRGPVSVFWNAARDLDPAVRDESHLAGVREGQLGALLRQAGLGPARTAALSVTVCFASFEEWWHPYTLGVGPAGRYAAALEDTHRRALRGRCRDLLPAGPLEVTAVAWTAACQPG